MLILKIIILFCFLGFCFCLFNLYKLWREMERNEKVGQFRHVLIDLCFKYNIRHVYDSDCEDAYDWFFGKYSYDDMLYSKKPLTLESWYTSEEIHKIKN